ncbi:DUF456 domain-containing protein [Arthrobacter rhombi]|uniref:DUF456 domain-containing protein n=1 Tax=Arthrobacter rhombi TaxID=71253 RepID=UPI003FCF74C4
MDTQILVTIIAGLLLAFSVVGTIYPVLPGSLLTILTLLGWALIIGGPAAWTCAAVGMLLALAGWSASMVLTGRSLKKQEIPRGTILFAVAAGIAGMFLIPIVGLFIGFGVGLLLAEYARRRSLRSAMRASLTTLKSTGVGILIEFGFAALAGSVWTIGVIWHFAAR